MSLVTDIVQLFGTSSVPVIVAGSVLGVFELGERFASQRAKDALSKWLISFDVQKAKALPDGTQELFERIFGERHFSLKCFARSAVFSVGAMAFIGLLLILIYPQTVAIIIRGFSYSWFGLPGTWLLISLWLPLSIFIDYISLLKTRFILHILTGLENSLVAIAILCIDLSVYSVLFALSFPAVLLAGICGYVFAYPHPLGVPQFCKGYVDFLSQISSEAGPVIRFIYHDVRYIYYFFLGRFCPFYLDVALRPCFVCNSCSPPK